MSFSNFTGIYHAHQKSKSILHRILYFFVRLYYYCTVNTIWERLWDKKAPNANEKTSLPLILANVSFRTDTFTNMMGGIFAEVAAITSEEKAQEIFFNTGYESGANFAERMSSEWGDSNDFDEIKKAIKEWCAFDSAVGWGKFEADITFDEDNELILGTLTIIKAFIVDTRHKRKICSFIRGYCTGVLNTLLGGLGVDLVCSSCPLEGKFSRNKCVFDIKMKG